MGFNSVFKGLMFVTYRIACNKYNFSYCKNIVNQQICIFYIEWQKQYKIDDSFVKPDAIE